MSTATDLLTRQLPASACPAASQTEIPVVEVSGLSKKFGLYTAVSNVSFTLTPGKTLVLLGESGSGKTTILRCVAGLESASSGMIRLAGAVVDDGRRHVPPEDRRIGMVFQSYALWPQMNALENVVFAGMRGRHGTTARREIRAQANELLNTVGLGALKDRLPAQLSGGQQQRVALSRALAGDVRLLLMDEPLSALDQSLREELRLGLRDQIKRSGLACLYVTHDQEEALAMADELMVMRAGRIEERGDPREIYERPSTAFGASFLGAKNVVYGTITRIGKPFSVAQVDSEQVTFLSGNALEIGDNVELRWRREHLRIRTNGEVTSVNRWRSRVVSSVYLGHRWEVGLNCLGTFVRAWSEQEVSGTVFAEVVPDNLLGYASEERSISVHDTS